MGIAVFMEFRTCFLTPRSNGRVLIKNLNQLRETLYVEEYGEAILRRILNKQTSRRLRWAGHVARMEEGRSAFKILTG